MLKDGWITRIVGLQVLTLHGDTSPSL